MSEQTSGVVNRVGSDETAFGDRSARRTLIITNAWTDPAENEQSVKWARNIWEAMQPFAGEGVYAAYLETDNPERIKAACRSSAYEQLAALENKYDPTNYFRVNQNIKSTI